MNKSQNFISHMVQMKLFYIADIYHLLKYFISHMVQMKHVHKSLAREFSGIFISHMVQMKQGYTNHGTRPFFLYIPHGSDETDHLHLIQVLQSTLYPTWFR